VTAAGRALLAAAVPLWQRQHAAIDGRLGADADRRRAGLRALS